MQGIEGVGVDERVRVLKQFDGIKRVRVVSVGVFLGGRGCSRSRRRSRILCDSIGAGFVQCILSHKIAGFTLNKLIERKFVQHHGHGRRVARRHRCRWRGGGWGGGDCIGDHVCGSFAIVRQQSHLAEKLVGPAIKVKKWLETTQF